MRETLEKQSEVIINIKVRENAKFSREVFYSFPIRQPLINTMVSSKQKRKSWTGEHTPISFKDEKKQKQPGASWKMSNYEKTWVARTRRLRRSLSFCRNRFRIWQGTWTSR